MRRNREQRFCELFDLGQQKILDILTGENDRGFLFTHTLGGIADIFDCREIGEEEVKLVDGSCCVTFGQALAAGVIPYVGFDLVKIVILVIVGPELRKVLIRANLVSVSGDAATQA